MHIDPYILAFSALTVIVTIWMGFWSAKRSKTTSDFFVAGRSVSVGWNASAISGEYLSAASFMGVAGMVMSSGYDALWYPVCYACGYLFLLLFIAGPLRRFGAYTIPDFAEGRFDSPVFRKIAVVFVLFIGFFYTMPQMKGAGTTLAYIFPGLPYWAGVVLVGAVITLNVALGGMKGITLVQAFQYWAKMFAISVPIFVLMAVYGHYGKQLQIQEQSKFEPEVRTFVQLPGFTVPFEAVNGFVPFRSFGDSGAGKFGANGLSLAELRIRAETFVSPPKPSPSTEGSGLMTAITEYARLLGETIWFHANLDLRMPGKFAYNPTNREATIKSVEQFFISQGLAIERNPRFGIRIAPSKVFAAIKDPREADSPHASASRTPLPAKAPTDSTWLNPFGPLTTKAAKAAAAALTNRPLIRTAWDSPIRGAGFALNGYPERLVLEFEALVERSDSASDKAQLARFRMSYGELSRTNFTIDSSEAIALLAKHEPRQVWYRWTPISPFPDRLSFDVFASSDASPSCERFREGFASAGFSFLESRSDLVVLPTAEVDSVMGVFQRYGLAGLHSGQLINTDTGVIGLIDSGRWTQPILRLGQRLKQSIDAWRRPSRRNTATKRPVWSAEVFDRIGKSTGQRLLVAYELVALEHADRTHGVWVQFSGSVSDRQWADVALGALATNGIVASDGFAPTKTNRCVIIRGADQTMFVLPQDRAEDYMTHPQLRAASRTVWRQSDLTRHLIQIAPVRGSDLSPPPPEWQIPVRKAASAAGLPVRDFGMVADSPGTNSVPLADLFTNYATILNRPIWVASDIMEGRATLVLTSYVVFHPETYLPIVNAALTNVGIAMIKDSKGALGFASAARAAAFQQLESFAEPRRTIVQEIPLRTDLAPDQRMSVNFTSPSVAQVLAVYADLTGRQLLPRTNSVAERIDELLAGTLSRWNLVSPNPTADSGARFHNDGQFTAAEIKAAIEANLRTNGIALVPEGAKHFRTVAADVSRRTSPGSAGEDQRGLTSAATDAQKAWLAKHERPLALLYTYSLIIALVCGTAGLPHILVRFYTNPDGVAAKRTTMWVMILIGVFYLFPPVFGVMGRNLMPELYNGLTGVKGTDGVVLRLPTILDGQKFGVLGSVLSGITCAGAFAAFMSTFSGLLVSMTGAMAHDVYGRMLNPKATPEQRLRAFKIAAVGIGAGAMLLGFVVESFEINKMVGWAFAIAATSYFPLLFLATWWRGITMKGAATGMLVGGTLSLAAIASTMFADQAPWAAGWKAWFAVHPLARTLAEQPAIWALPLALLLMFVVSKLTAREVPGDIRMKMLVLHAPEKLGLKQEYIQEHQPGH